MYFATIFRDSYLESERRDMAEWLDDLFPVNGGSEFAPQVVYLYWDYSTHEPLYLGLASEARRRFEEHNGLRYSAPGSSKKKEIDDYFTKQSRLGFSVIAASSSAPINTAATRQANKSLRPWNGLTWGLEEAAEDELRMFEGRFINAGKSAGVLPWNNIQGWWRGAVTAQSHSALVLGLFTGQADSLFVARHSLRHIAQDYAAWDSANHALRELDMHTCRVVALFFAGHTGADDGDVMRWLSAPDADWAAFGGVRPNNLDLLFHQDDSSGYLASDTGRRHCVHCVMRSSGVDPVQLHLRIAF